MIALAAVGGAITAGPASAHAGDRDYASTLESTTPAVPGISARVDSAGSRITATNTSSRTLTILGYDGEPYARIRPGGIVERNTRSPATYLNATRDGTGPVPAVASSDPATPPAWRVVGRGGRFTWHDHRNHWMAAGRPAAVTDVHRRTRLFDWSIPVRVDGRPGAVTGTLYWAGRPEAAPLWPVILFIAGAAVAGTATLLANRRRDARLHRTPSAPRPGAEGA